jgi:subtilisin family serine protease
MFRRSLALWVAVAFALLFLAPGARSQAQGKRTVKTANDLPRFTYPIKGKASDLLQSDPATFNQFAVKVQADLETILRDYEITDKATLRSLLQAKLDLQQLAGQYQAALQTVSSLRALEEKPAAKLTSGLFTNSVLQAAIETKSTAGPAFEQAFTKHYREAIDPLPWPVVQDSVKFSFRGSQTITSALLIGGVQTELDPAAKKSGALDNLQAWELIDARVALQFMVPLKTQRAAVLGPYVKAHNAPKPDIWEAREMTLTPEQKLTPVVVGVWDSGVDVSLFPNQLFNDPHPTASGTHGLAFDDRGNPSSSWLYPLTAEQQQRYPTARDFFKGSDDALNGIDSSEAAAYRQKLSSSSADQAHALFEQLKVTGFYIHGTHVAGILVRGNPAARIVVARFNDQLPDLPFAPTTEWAQQMSSAFQQMSDYFRTRNVRVVNLSWGDDVQEFESWLSKTGGGGDPAERKRKAEELYGIWHDAVENAIKNAPDTLFVAAAGNSDSNAGFLGDVPASFHLPNLIVVGAVNQAGEETSFTSYGDTVAVDADGYEVESYVPGGARLKLSGTSMASPNVANLAAKLFALDPSLTPAQVIELIKSGATTSEDGRRHLIDEKRSVALVERSSTGTPAASPR